MTESRLGMAEAGTAEKQVQAGCMSPWDVGQLPAPPVLRFDPRRVIGPGLMMVGAAIGGGEWLVGPANTAQYGGALMWIATLSILFQAAYNTEVMRYTLYCGEPIFVGFFRSLPGPAFWTGIYIVLDFVAILPYLSANAASPLVALFLRRPPIDTGVEALYVQLTSYVVLLGAFVPLIFGGKIYNTLERLMVAKIILVLGYLTFIGVFYVGWSAWAEVFSGFLNFGGLPTIAGEQLTWSQVLGSYFGSAGAPKKPPLDLALLSAFAAIAGAGGLTNTAFSSYVREKGWGMGPLVGAIPSAVGGTGVKLSHNGKVFRVTPEAQKHWRGWRNITLRDQLGIWVAGCILGMGIPSLVSLQFVRGATVNQNNVAAMTAQGIFDHTGIHAYRFLTLLCGFLVLATSQVSSVDGLVRRWTDVIWTASRRLRRLEGDKVKYVYYTILACYGIWGLFVLTVFPKPLILVKLSGVMLNFALGFSALHTLTVNCIFLPKELRPGWFMRLSLVGCAIFFVCMSLAGMPRALDDLGIL